MPHRLIVDTESGILPCEVAAEHVDTVARYIIGTAAILSGDLPLAEQLLLVAAARLASKVKVAEGTPSAVLLDRVQGRLKDLYAVWLDRSTARYIRTRDGASLNTSVPHFQDHASDNWGPEGAGSDGVVNRSWSGRRSNMLSWSTCSIW